MKQPNQVFISYSWDSDEHRHEVLKLASALARHGIPIQIDRINVSPEEGWQAWMMNQIEYSDFVLVVCTEEYNHRFRNRGGDSRGVVFEGGLIIEELFERGGINNKFIPIILKPEDEDYVPSTLKRFSRYKLFDSEYDPRIRGEYQELYRHLTDQPSIFIRPGELIFLPSEEF